MTRQATNLREAHVHLPHLARSLTMTDLSACTSVEEVLETLRVAARDLTNADLLDSRGTGRSNDGSNGQYHRWLVAQGMRVEGFRDPRWPTRQELNAALTAAGSPPRPVVVLSFDYHSLVANELAFAAANIRDNDPDPPADFGVVSRDAGGVPTGLLLEGMARKVRDAIPDLAPAERPAAIARAIEHLQRLGFSEVHDMLATPWLGDTLAALHDAGKLPIRVGLYAEVDILNNQVAAAKHYTRPGHVELLGGKIFVDGTLNARTAWMLHPFADPIPQHPLGTPLLTHSQIANAMQLCASHGLGLACHAIGDAAVRAVLDVQEKSNEVTKLRSNAATSSLRLSISSSLRIEHAELIDESDIPRFAKLNVTASVQPCHLLYDIEVLERQCPTRLDRVMPLRDLLNAGLVPGKTLLFGSDVPIVRANPQDSIDAAVHRKRITGSPAGPPTTRAIAPTQALDADTAWRCFLQNS
ncbi:MAG: amidohydrolase family protein [Phycisphaerales bacterium]